MAVLDPVPGEWYFTVHCCSCKSVIRFFPDENKGNRPITAKKILHVQCRACGASHEYSTNEMKSTQEPEKAEGAS
jgi:hypothetical protein